MSIDFGKALGSYYDQYKSIRKDGSNPRHGIDIEKKSPDFLKGYLYCMQRTMIAAMDLIRREMYEDGAKDNE